MSKKVKVKIKQGKVKMKLKAGDDALPLDAADLRELLGFALASAVGGQLQPRVRTLPASPDDAASSRPPQLTGGAGTGATGE
jgi:hypothetical protein